MWSIGDMSLTDSKLARSIFGQITLLREWATMSMPAKLFSPRTLDTLGVPDHKMVEWRDYDRKRGLKRRMVIGIP